MRLPYSRASSAAGRRSPWRAGRSGAEILKAAQVVLFHLRGRKLHPFPEELPRPAFLLHKGKAAASAARRGRTSPIDSPLCLRNRLFKVSEKREPGFPVPRRQLKARLPLGPDEVARGPQNHPARRQAPGSTRASSRTMEEGMHAPPEASAPGQENIQPFRGERTWAVAR